jgi:hypothetical protein
MNILFEICLFLLLFGVPLQLYYWCVLRPVFFTRNIFALERLQERLKSLPESIKKESKEALPILHKKIGSALPHLSSIDVLVAMQIKVTAEFKLRIERDNEIIANAPVEVRKINQEIEYLVASSAIVNSPGLIVLAVLFLPIVFALALCCLAINRVKYVIGVFRRRLWASTYMPQTNAVC